MPISVLFIQGAGQDAHATGRAMADGLQRALGRHYKLAYPRMPGEYDPKPEAWKRTITLEAQACRADIIVAHSVGAAIVADLLAAGGDAALPQVQTAFLLAPPYIGRAGWPLGGYRLDALRANPPAVKVGLFFYFGAADTVVPTSHAALYEQVFPRAAYRQFSQCGHRFAGHLPLVAQDIDTTARALGLREPGRG